MILPLCEHIDLAKAEILHAIHLYPETCHQREEKTFYQKQQHGKDQDYMKFVDKEYPRESASKRLSIEKALHPGVRAQKATVLGLYIVFSVLSLTIRLIFLWLA